MRCRSLHQHPTHHPGLPPRYRPRSLHHSQVLNEQRHNNDNKKHQLADLLFFIVGEGERTEKKVASGTKVVWAHHHTFMERLVSFPDGSGACFRLMIPLVEITVAPWGIYADISAHICCRHEEKVIKWENKQV